MHCRSLTLLATLGLSCLIPAYAQQTPSAPPPPAPTLAQALAGLGPPAAGVVLAVGADKVTLPRGADPAAGQATTPVGVAADYGLITQDFGDVTAVAPPIMTVLNTDPATPNPYEGMPPADALKLLAGSLDDGQWQALTGGQGLGYAGLTTQAQQQLFMALFPGGTLAVQPQSDRVFDPEHVIILTPDNLQQARLRLSQQVTLMLQAADNSGGHSGGAPDPGDVGDRYMTGAQHGAINDGDTVYGIRVRATVPNALKPSELDAADLTVPVPLAGVKTVGDLVTHIGAATETELYADRRYENRSVTFVGPASAHAGDLLRALALCVSGTYRKVGPAYVLTDDLIGYGTRQMILNRFAQAADMARAGALADAGDKMLARGGVYALSPTAPGMGLTDAQLAREKNDPDWDPHGQFSGAGLPFDQLTPQQQDLARRELQQFREQDRIFGAQRDSMTLAGTIILQPQPLLQLLSSAVPGPVTLGNQLNIGQLFQPSAKLQQQLNKERVARWQAHRQQEQADAAKNPKAAPPVQTPPPPPPSLDALLSPIPRRAVYAHPRTAADVDDLVASMRRVGLNQLWLDVFSGGKSRLDGTPDGKPDILTEALARTRGAGISVVPAVDMLTWATDAPEGAADRTILGETSAQDADYQQRYQAIVNQDMTESEAAAQPPSKALSVSPTAPPVVDALTALVQRLAATPGVTVLAVTDTVTSGYNHPPGVGYGGSYDLGGAPLGYTVPLRLACLRRAHVDPVDISVGLPAPIGRRASLAEFEGNDRQATQEMNKDWDAGRAEADVGLMRRLLAAAQAGAGRPVPFLVEQRGMQYRTADWWGLWADPRAPLPAQTNQGGLAIDDFAAFAHTQSRVDLYALPTGYVLPAGAGWAGRSAGDLAVALQKMKPGWDGFVLDVGTAETSDPLAALASAAPVKKP